MKKHILLGATLLSLFAASCSNDDVVNNDNEVVNGKTITLNATISNGTDARLAYSDNGTSKVDFTWSNNEIFTIYKGTSSDGSTFKNSANAKAKFKGSYIEGAGDGGYYAVYGDNISNTDGTLTIDLSDAQVGTAADNGIKAFMLATADALTSSTTLTFDYKLTVLKMTLTLPSDVTGTVSKVTVSGLHNKASYTLTNGSYTYADTDKKDITATNEGTGFTITDHKITAYVAVFPENVSANQVTIKATVGDNEYSYTIASERTLQENQVVPVPVTLAAPVPTNFKSAYTADDYKTWSDENCKNAPSYDDMCKYLGAGVYWDNGDEGDNRQTYTVNGSECHAGLWLMKKEYISGFSEGTAKQSDSANPTNGRPTDIDKYFFLPAAGSYNDSNNSFEGADSFGGYWSSSSDAGGGVHCLFFYDGGASMFSISRGCGYLPMVAE